MPGVTDHYIRLGVFIFLIIFQVICATLNGYILYLFIQTKNLRQNKHMRLVLFLTLGDFLLAVGELPYTIYLIKNWDPYLLDYNPLNMMLLAQPLPIGLKISATLTVGIALGRNMALCFPSIYRRMNQTTFANFVLCVALGFALFDDFLYWYTTELKRYIDCGSIGCFVSNEFRLYWGISNMILGLMTVFLTITIFLKLRLVSKSKAAQHSANTYAKANRTSTGILVSSLLFLTVPSVCVGIVELAGVSLFKLVGPFYSAGLLVSGCYNAAIFIASNWTNIRPNKITSSVVVQKLSTGFSAGSSWK